jgi:hypothetical protein
MVCRQDPLKPPMWLSSSIRRKPAIPLSTARSEQPDNTLGTTVPPGVPLDVVQRTLARRGARATQSADGQWRYAASRWKNAHRGGRGCVRGWPTTGRRKTRRTAREGSTASSQRLTRGMVGGWQAGNMIGTESSPSLSGVGWRVWHRGCAPRPIRGCSLWRLDPN